MKRWSNDEQKYLEECYGKVPTKEIADHLGRTVDSVNLRANRTGVRSGRYLTEEENAFLEKNSHMTNKKLAKILGRSETAMKTMRYNKGLPLVKEAGGEGMCLSEVARLVGVNKANIQRTWVSNGLKTKKSGKYKIVMPNNLFKFMQTHPNLWDATKCEKWYFEQYEWFRQKRKEDFRKMTERRWGYAEKTAL